MSLGNAGGCCLLILACLPAAGQREVCDAATAASEAEMKLAGQHTSAAVEAAKSAPAALWALLVDPDTRYPDRLAAAHHGAAGFPASYLPRIWAAQAELNGIPSTIGAHPCTPFWHRRGPAGLPARASLLGRPVEGKSADRLPPFPATPDQRRTAPWEWQMQQAFRILSNRLSQRYSSSQAYELLLDQAWKWKPADGQDEMVWRLAILYSAPHNASWIRAVLKLSAIETPPADVLHGLPYRSPWESTAVTAIRALELADPSPLIQGARIFTLQTTRDGNVAQAASWHLQPGSPTAVLAVARWAIDQNVAPTDRMR